VAAPPTAWGCRHRCLGARDSGPGGGAMVARRRVVWPMWVRSHRLLRGGTVLLRLPKGVERRCLRGAAVHPRPAQQTGPRGHFLLRSGVFEFDVERELHQAQAGSLCLFPHPLRRASRPPLSAAALFPLLSFRSLHPDSAGARVTRRCLGTPLPYWCSCGRCGCWCSCGRCGCCSGGRCCGGLLGRPSIARRIELFTWTAGWICYSSRSFLQSDRCSPDPDHPHARSDSREKHDVATLPDLGVGPVS
jgi:hypothetical protein